MARKRTKREDHAGELNMVAMIDVAMQMLNFFIVTATAHDVYANLDVFQPSPDSRQQERQEKPRFINVAIYPEGGFTINDKQVDITDLDRLLSKLASLDTTQTIIIKCTALSSHSDLIKVLDLCAKSGLVNISVMSTN